MASHYLVLLQCFIGVSLASQVEIDYLARHIQIEYEVVTHFEAYLTFKGNIFFTNTGDDVITTNAWSLYFCHFGTIEAFRMDPDGVELGDSGLKVFWIQGCLHKIEPLDTFPGFPIGERIQTTFVAPVYHAARSDIFPNWYFVDPDSEPRTVLSTVGEDLDWVWDFVRPEQWKRAQVDTYDPYTPEQRLAMIDYENLGSSPAWILPTPASEDLNPDSVVNIGSGDWVVVAEDPSLVPEAEFLALRLNTIVADTDATPASRYVILRLGDVIEGEVSVTESEAYHLSVTQETDVIDITGNDAAGVFYGIQSLLSLYDASEEIPTGDVVDYARFHYRGMHLDVSRNFHGKLEVFKLLESMSMYKLNKFHFHLTDDEGWRLEIPGLPELTEVGAHRCYDPTGESCILPQRGSNPGPSNDGSGFYSVQDYTEILEFAKLRHIEVIPEIDMPGHAHAAIHAMLARYRTYADVNMTTATEFLLSDFNDTSEYSSAQQYSDNAMNPCLESTLNFVAKVLMEVIKLHAEIQPLRVFHFGGDEVARGAWLGSAACQALASPGEVDQETVMAGFVLRVADLALGWGLDLAGWEDGLMEGEQPINRTLFRNENVYGYLWQNMWELGNGNVAYTMVNAGYKAILAHMTHFYYDHPYEPDPEERGFYWGTRVISTRKVFGYMPASVYDNMDVTSLGTPVDKERICQVFGCPPLLPGKAVDILGIQGNLWCEVVRKPDQLESQIFPRLVALAERAWHKASWEDVENEIDREVERSADWANFANALGHKELGRLDRMGVAYRVSLPGASLSDDLELHARIEYPGLLIQYSLNGGSTWWDYSVGTSVPGDTDIVLLARSADYRRVSRQVTVLGKPAPPTEGPDTSGAEGLQSFVMLTMAAILLA